MSTIKSKQVRDKTVEIKQVNDIMFQLWVNGIMVLQSMSYDEILEKFTLIDDNKDEDRKLIETLEKVYSILNGD